MCSKVNVNPTVRKFWGCASPSKFGGSQSKDIFRGCQLKNHPVWYFKYHIYILYIIIDITYDALYCIRASKVQSSFVFLARWRIQSMRLILCRCLNNQTRYCLQNLCWGRNSYCQVNLTFNFLESRFKILGKKRSVFNVSYICRFPLWSVLHVFRFLFLTALVVFDQILCFYQQTKKEGWW